MDANNHLADPVAAVVEAFKKIAPAPVEFRIRALKIEHANGELVYFAPGWTPVRLPPSLVGRARHGDYFIQHGDGHVAIVDAAFFEYRNQELRSGR